MSTTTAPQRRAKPAPSDRQLDQLIEKKVREFLLHRPEVLIEALEDAVLGRLIEEGSKSGPASPERIQQLLRRGRA